MFKNIDFIKSPKEKRLEYSLSDPAPLFRKKFTVKGNVQKAVLSVCGLGYGYYYLNGQIATQDLFTAPVSDYNKTLWYNVYDVTDKVITGDNVVCAMCGNGNFNENVTTAWNINKAVWRDNPKFILKLEVTTDEGTVLVVSDSSWKCTENSPVVFNELRNGEYFDSRIYDENWTSVDFDDSNWLDVAVDDNAPKGVFRECLCEPIREMQTFKPVSITKNQKGNYVFDFGQNVAGYVRLKVKQPVGTELTLKYAERLGEDGSITLDWLGTFYNDSHFQTDKFICNGEEFTWSPKFVYHGFQYVEISGLVGEPSEDMLTSIFVHQAFDQTSTFECSNELFNKIYKAGILATLSNLHYLPTDCPTREKLGWANDMQASTEQFLINFPILKFFEKWYQDILDSVDEIGRVPCVIPSAGWGYEWGSGPVSDGILFELPYRLFLHTGNKEYLIKAVPHFKKYLKQCIAHADSEGLLGYGLSDWAGPFENASDPEICPTPRLFTDSALYMKFLKIAILAAGFAGDNDAKAEIQAEFDRFYAIFKAKFMNPDGTCKVQEQTAISMLIYHDFYDELEPLKTQLVEQLEAHDFHLYCGMVGMRHLLHALNKCGLYEYAYKVATSKGYPSYSLWIESGANTLWEMWDGHASLNHHMYSDILSWMMKTVVGINPEHAKYAPSASNLDSVAYKIIAIEPIFFENLDYAKGSIKTPNGDVAVAWAKNDDGIALDVTVPTGSAAKVKLHSACVDGKSEFELLEGKHKLVAKV